MMCLRASEEDGHVLQLGDVVLSVAAVFGEQRQVLQIFSAGVSRVQLGQLPEDHGPRPDLLRRVLDTRDGLPAGGGGTKYCSTVSHNTDNIDWF